MGGIISSLFGGSQQKENQSSSNRAFDLLSNPLQSEVQGGSNVFNQLTSTLGQGFDAYKKNAGYDFALNRGNDAITGNAAAHGLLNSGSTDKALATFETGLGSQTYNNYLDRLQGAAGIGNQAGQVLDGAGNVSTGSSSGSNNKGLLGNLSPLASLFA